ncbi:MAG: carboxypeptidase regulatory-like domain-containing protein, partial [Longimicrobiales bacterium]
MNILYAVLLASGTTGAAIQGIVRVAGTLEPIANATITIAGLDRLVVADAKGFFVLADVPSGSWEVEASAPGYASNALTVVSSGTGVIRLDFELAIRPVELDPLDVDADGSSATVPVRARAPSSAGPPAARLDGPSIKRMPGLVEADVLRALHVLPAVSAISDFSSALYVRGGSADQNLITLDGIPLFNPYHVGGIFSAIGADAVSSVDVWAGAFPAASAGDRLSSVVQIHTREGGRDRVRSSGAIGLLAAHLTLDGPLGAGGAFLFSGRRTYLDVVSDAAYGVGLIDNTLPYGFSDAYLKLSHRVGALGSISLSGYLDLESVRFPERMRHEHGLDLQFGWGARMLALSYRQPIGGSLLLEARAGFTGFAGDFDGYEYSRGQSSCDGPPGTIACPLAPFT